MLRRRRDKTLTCFLSFALCVDQKRRGCIASHLVLFLKMKYHATFFCNYHPITNPFTWNKQKEGSSNNLWNWGGVQIQTLWGNIITQKVQTNKVQQYTCHSNEITYMSNFSKHFYLCCISGTYAIVSKNPSKYFVLCHHEKYLQNILEFFFNGWQNPRQYVYS